MQLTDWQAPAIVVGATGLAIQGVKAVFDAVIQVRNRRTTHEQQNLAYLIQILTLIGDLPIGEAQRTAWRRRILVASLPSEKGSALAQILTEALGEQND